MGEVNPLIFGGIYLFLIPFFALILHFMDFFKIVNNQILITDFGSALYFSAVTITTLGYGDILPFNMETRFIVVLEAGLGVVLAGLFLNSLAHRQTKIIADMEEKKFKKSELNKRISKLKGFNKLIDLNLQQYEKYIIVMTSPIGSPARPYGMQEPDFKLNRDFKFSDIKDLYKHTGRLGDNGHESAVEYFYKSLDRLIDSLEQALSLDIFVDFKELEGLVREFILLSRQWDMRDVLLAQIHTKMGEEKAVIFYENMIQNLTDGEMEIRSAYIMNPFIILFHFLKESCVFIEKYKSYMHKIENPQN